MKIQEAANTIAQHSRDTGKIVSESIEELWPSLDIDDDAVETLAREGLLNRAVRSLTNPLSNRQPETTTKISVTLQKSVERTIEVKVHLLRDTYYRVNGVVKPVISFTIEDVDDRMRFLLSMESGIANHRKLLDYARIAMDKYSSTTVGDLPEEEQLAIAKMLFEATNRSERLSLEAELKA